ncbi:GAF domain-containing protein [Kribbella sp. NPDC055071]
MSSYRGDGVLELCSAPDLLAVETGVLELAIRVVPCAFAGLAGAGAGGGMVVVSDRVVEEADRLQKQYGEGPRLLPSGTDAVVCIADSASDARWPGWGRELAALGLRSMLSLELSARSAGLGALVLYAPDPGWFGPTEQCTAVAVARHASVAIAARRQESRLRRVMESRGVIGRLHRDLLSPLRDVDGRIRR